MRWGRWSHDVSYLVTSSLSVEDRRANERRLLDSYVSALRANGVVECPSAEEAWRAYSQAMAYGLFGWFTAPAYFGYPEAVSNVYAAKFATAAWDCDMLGGLGLQ
jgi:hypothetical protein